MKIDKKDFERVMKKLDVPIDKKNITDPKKYWYWYSKSDEYINKMNENNDDKEKFKNYMHDALLCEFEKNRYCRINKKEKILLYTLVRYHNSLVENEKRLFFDEKGRRVKRHDRRAIRINSDATEFSES